MRTMLMAALLALGCGGGTSNTIQNDPTCPHATAPNVTASYRNGATCDYVCRPGLSWCEPDGGTPLCTDFNDDENCGACGRRCANAGQNLHCRAVTVGGSRTEECQP